MALIVDEYGLYHTLFISEMHYPVYSVLDDLMHYHVYLVLDDLMH